MKKFDITVSLSVLLALYTTQASAWGSMTDDIYSAARNGNVRQLEYYANRGNLDVPNRDGTTALCKAYAEGNTKAYNLLLQYGANPHASCMHRVESLRSTGISRISPTAYVVGGVVLVGAGVAVAAGGGGGGGNDTPVSKPNDLNDDGNTSENNTGEGSSAEVGEDTIVGGTPGGGYSYGVSIGEEQIITGGDDTGGGNTGGDNTGGSGVTIGDEVVIGGGDNTGGDNTGGSGVTIGDEVEIGGGDNTGGSNTGGDNTGGSGVTIGDEVEIGGGDNTGGDNTGGDNTGGSGVTIGDEVVIGGGDNTGGDNTGGDNTGGDNTGGDNTGGDNTGGDNTGGDNTGGDNTGGDNTGGDNTGGDNTGGDNTGGDNTGGDNTGGDNTGGDNTGGDNAGGDNTGGDNTGGDNTGGDNTGGDNTGGDNTGGDNTGGDNTGGDNTGGDNTGGDDNTPTLHGNVATFYPESYYLNRSEYTGQNFGNGSTKKSVNYLGAINAAQAYSYFIGTDADGKLATNLQDVTVGVVDTGVWLTHSEFKLDDGSSKVSGFNYDFGPCRNGDTTNCWGIRENLLGKQLVLYSVNSEYTSYDWYLTSEEVAEFEKWASFYPDNYDWDAQKTNVQPNLYASSTGEIDYNNMHGTHVSGLIAGNMDGKGMMGVAFANAKIKATRWDFQSTLLYPVNYLLENGARIINLSMGMSDTSESKNASKLSSDSQLSSGFRQSMQAVLSQNGTKNGKIDGVIVVKAAGNEGVSNPDLQSGIKNLNAYKNLQILVVAAADVTIDSSTGKLQSYSLSSYSNQCGVTKGYCLTAPGGDVNGSVAKGIYSSGQIGGSQNYYATIGTSQATPIVSGALAFLEGAFPYMSSQEVIELVLTTANKTAAVDYSEEKYGAGMLDLGAAVVTYIPHSQNMQVATFSGNSIQSMPINLDGTSLVVSSVLQEAVQKALPASITTFDRYNRPFDKPTANFVKTTHSGYKTLKNDVQNIALPQEISFYKEGNISFQYADSMRKNGVGEKGYFNIAYKNDKHSSSFYFSENTAYKSAENVAHEMKNPFMAMNNAYGVRHDYDFNKKMRFKIEAVSGENGLYDGDKDFNDCTFKRRAYAVNTGVQLHQDKKYSLALSSGMLYEQDALLGANGSGAFALKGGNTYTVGIHAAWKPVDKFTLSGSYYRGYTAAQSFEADLLRTSKIESSSFAFEGDYEADKETHMGLRFSSPLRVEKGRLFVDFPSGRDSFSDTVYRKTYDAGLKPSKREYKLAIYWQKKISEKISLRTESGVRFNPEHQNAANDYRALVGLSWTFN